MMHVQNLLQPFVITDIRGLKLTLAGALVSARGAFVEDRQSRQIARTAGDHNHASEATIKQQSRCAKYGFALIAVGTIL